MSTYLLDLGTTISASVSYCLIQSLWFNLQKRHNKHQEGKTRPSSAMSKKRKQGTHRKCGPIKHITCVAKYQSPTESNSQTQSKLDVWPASLPARDYSDRGTAWLENSNLYLI